ncbi:MAG: phosphoribosylformylglycinamidine synthase subunit PurS [Actinomycetota bacterium]
MRYRAEVSVMLKPGISDPQGQTIERALPALGYEGVSNVRVGKLIELHLDAANEDDARERVGQMCEQLLANTVLEAYGVKLNASESAS